MFLDYFKVSPNIPDPNFQTKMSACFDLAAYIPSTEKVKIYDGKKENISDVKQNEDKVKNLGGLFIIGTERQESRRIDNQLR